MARKPIRCGPRRDRRLARVAFHTAIISDYKRRVPSGTFASPSDSDDDWALPEEPLNLVVIASNSSVRPMEVAVTYEGVSFLLCFLIYASISSVLSIICAFSFIIPLLHFSRLSNRKFHTFSVILPTRNNSSATASLSVWRR